jgi:hypothetical protein
MVGVNPKNKRAVSFGGLGRVATTAHLEQEASSSDLLF